MSNAKRIAKNTIWLFVSEVITIALGYFIFIMLARYLGEEGIGIYSFAFAFASIFLMFSDLGIFRYMIREIAREKSKTRLFFSNALTLKLILGFIAFILATITINLTKNPGYIKTAVYIASITVIVRFMGDFLKKLIEAYEVMHYEAIIKVIEKVVTLGAILVLIFFDIGLVSIILAFLAASLFSALLYLFVISKKITKITLKLDLKYCINMLKKSFPFFVTGFFVQIYYKIDTIMLSLMTNYAVVGWYNASLKLIEGLHFIPTLVVTAIFPAMSIFFLNNNKSLKLLHNKAFKYLFILAVPLAIGTTLIAEEIIITIYGQEFTNSTIILKVLIWAELFLFLNILHSLMLNAMDKQTITSIIAFFVCIFNLTLNYLLIPTYSHVGAAMASLISQLLNFILLYLVIIKSGFKVPLMRIVVWPSISGILMSALIYSLKSIDVLLIIPFSALFYFGFLFLTKTLGKEELNLLKSIFNNK